MTFINTHPIVSAFFLASLAVNLAWVTWAVLTVPPTPQEESDRMMRQAEERFNAAIRRHIHVSARSRTIQR